ncbi:hypothetical protein MRB53_040038 [Persea americana]|nr:hypothetical protein MRB53_040038 [Persea americana]
MAGTPISLGASIPLPPLPKQDPLNQSQWAVLAAIVDTVIPSFVPGKGNYLIQHPLPQEQYDSVRKSLATTSSIDNGDGLLTRYLQENATAQPEFKDSIFRLISQQLDPAAAAGIRGILSILSTRAGALAFTGTTTPFPQLSILEREKILQGWANSRIPLFRGLQRSFTSLGKVYWLRTSPTLPYILGYPRIPTHGAPAQDGYPFQFIQIPPGSTPETIETDVVIVGSGCGGAVAAHTLAQAGLKVMVVDKSYYYSPAALPLSELEAAHHIFENGGVHMSDDATISVVAGMAWGGGGTVNWSASLQTLGPVRREWSHKFGLPYFTSSDFQSDLDYVCDRMGVGKSDIPHNKTNRVLLDGARKLG